MRTEIYAVAAKYHGAVQDVRNFLSELGFTAPEDFTDHLYSFHDDAAVTHLFRVASGLDSAVLGEGEVLGQVRDAWEKARTEGAAGPVLSGLFRHAVEVGKRARAETAIARGTTSVSQAAVEMAVRQLGSLEGRSMLVLGAGDMGEGIAVALSSTAASSRVLVANRTWARAAAVAARVGGEAIDFGSLGAALEDVDVLLTTTGSPSVLIEASDVAGVMDARERDLLIVDIAVPRDVDPAVRRLPGVTLLDMDDLQRFAEAGIAGRRGEITKVETIIAEEVQRYLDAATAREAAPLVAALRERAEGVRQGELARLASRLDGLEDRERQAVEALTRGIVNKLLHEPTVRLKDAAGSPRGDALAEAVRALFDLE
jgi:glutamyl-tRNA reductase